MTDFEFLEELPERVPVNRAGDPLLLELADALRARPGVWAAWPRRVAESTARAIGSYVQAGRYVALPAGEFEASLRNGVAYIRYIGKEAK